MQLMRLLLVLVGLISIDKFDLSANPMTDRGLRLNLNSAGLELIATEIKNNSLESIRDAQLPKIKEMLEYGVKLEAEGLQYSIDFTHLRIIPLEGSLSLDLGVKGIKIDIANMKVSKKVLVNLSTSCKDTQIRIAHTKNLSLQASLPVWVDQYNIKTKIEHLDFEIPDDQYQVIGPSKCSGALGVGNLIKSIAHRILSSSKQKIVDAVKRKLKGAEERLAQELNQIAHQSFELRGSALPGLPQMSLTLNVRPFNVDLDGHHLGIEFAVDTNNLLMVFAKQLGSKFSDRWTDQHIGAIGINPKVLNEAIADWLKYQKEGFDINSQAFPVLRGFLNKNVARNTWPNLPNLKLTSEDLLLKLEFFQAPRIVFDDGSNNLKMLADLILTFKIELDGSYVDYYHLDLRLEAFAFLGLEGEVIKIGFTDIPSAEWKGGFSRGFQSDVNLVHHEVLEVLVHGLMTGLYEEGSFLRILLPEMQLGGKYIKASTLYYDSPYISVGLQASDDSPLASNL